jgi:phenylpyruvate tautomerase PptA (4-oxalocrotonate tautomerase family)
VIHVTEVYQCPGSGESLTEVRLSEKAHVRLAKGLADVVAKQLNKPALRVASVTVSLDVAVRGVEVAQEKVEQLEMFPGAVL